MSYLKIPNLYRDQRIFQFAECWALEKIHGTSAHVDFKMVPDGESRLSFYSGGEKHDNFVALFDQEFLRTALTCVGQPHITIYGEAYGGKQQRMAATYGPNLKFVAFDVRMAGHWLDVPDAERLVRYLKLEFVDYKRGPATLEFLDAERDRDSVQAIRNGMGEGKKREGIVVRPIGEINDEAGDRIITKHKRLDFQETRTSRPVADPNKLKLLADAKAIATEWVTPMRLAHVLDKARARKNVAGDPTPISIEDTGTIIRMMLDDVKLEAKGEIVESSEALRAIGAATAKLFKGHLSGQQAA